jgi:MOSC domain-containing protein YiiM
MPHIVSISYRPSTVEQKPADHYARVGLERAQLVEGHGIDGDTKGGRDDRHINFMLADILEQLAAKGFRTGPGEMGEQIVIAGLDRAVLANGARLRLGSSAVIEVANSRTGCSRFAHIQGKPIPEARCMGFMARVVRGGTIAVGDAVLVNGPTEPVK